MYEFLKDKLTYFISTFRGSELIIWARVQVAVGTVYTVASTADLTPLDIDPKYVAYWTIANGLISEFLRRHREEWDGSDSGTTK